MLGLGRHSEQLGDEQNLCLEVPFLHTIHLPFPEHIHHFIALDRSPRRFKGEEAESWFDEPFEKPVVLLSNGVQIFDLPQFTAFWQLSCGFEFPDRFGIGRVFVHGDDARSGRVTRSKGPAEKPLGRFGIACRTEPKWTEN